MMCRVCLFVAVFLAVSVNAQRETVPFSYAWRFKFGHEPGALPGPNSCSTFSTDVSTLTCTNIDRNPNRFTPEDCARGCCYEPSCYVWQSGIKARSCYWGGKDSVCTASSVSNATATPWPVGEIDAGMQRASVPPIKTQYSRSAAGYDDSAWTVVDAPHDALMTTENIFQNQTDINHAFRNRNVTWYRKHFTLPQSWDDGSTIELYFEGVFHFTQVWLNGEYLSSHSSGYTSFTVRLDNATSIKYGAANVLAVRADATFGSGHWYEGGGIYRHVLLQKLHPVHIVQDGVFAVSSEWDGKSPIVPTAEVENFGSSPAADVSVRFDLMDGSKILASATSMGETVPTTGTTVFTSSLDVLAAGASLWSVSNPTTYTIVATVQLGSTPVDDVTVPTGFRTLKYTGDQGFFLNGEHVRFRGFSHHNSFSGVGTALSQRLYLFQAQASRALGGQIWRNSHNPYTPKLYPILNALGVLNWDETRDHGKWYVDDMASMVRRDRNHPAIVIWSSCNEAECGSVSNDTAIAFRAATKAMDTTRPLGANQGTWAWSATSQLDVSGWSHSKNETFTSKHNADPDLPLVLSECCSCTSQRSDRDVPDCVRDQNDPGMLYDYVTGSLGVWTLMDYYGESHTWPRVSSPYGQFDIAGFPKPHSAWYRTNWLGLVPASDAGRPPLPVEPFIKLLTLLDQPLVNYTTIGTTPTTQLFIDGVHVDTATTTPGYEHVWPLHGHAPKSNVTAKGLSPDGSVAVTHTVHMPTAAGAKQLSLDIDVPSPITGTGSALLLDGSDQALLRVTLADAAGHLVTSQSVNVTFSIVSGPGRVFGTGNGDPALSGQPHNPTVYTFLGLARGVVQVSYDCTSANRNVAAAMDVDGNRRTKVVPQGDHCPTEPIVVQASTPGLPPATVSIPTSYDPVKDSPEAVAKANVHLSTWKYSDIQA